MVGFLGQSVHSIDDKGRVALPARMRRELSPDANETFIAWQGIEQCVTLIPKNVWKEKADLLTKLSPFLKDNRIVKRTESRRAEQVILDAQGRISLPRTHIDHAGLAERARLDASGIDETQFLQTIVDIAATGRTRAETLLDAYARDWDGDIDRLFEAEAF